MFQLPAPWRMKKTGAEYPLDSSATRLSRGDPVGFPPHPCEWFSIIVYLPFIRYFARSRFRTSSLVMLNILKLRLNLLADEGMQLSDT
jgi:hypothetical protein